jgi:hypothetical protein
MGRKASLAVVESAAIPATRTRTILPTKTIRYAPERAQNIDIGGDSGNASNITNPGAMAVSPQ